MLMYFAGAEVETHRELLFNNNVGSVLCSAFGLNYKRSMNSYRKFQNILLDSGGYTARMQNVQIDVKDYANFINKNDIQLAFNLDTNDVKETLFNQGFLETNTSAYILPVYHFSDYTDNEHKHLLDEMIGNYSYISIGGVAGMKLGARKEIFYDYVFSKISKVRNQCKVHGLGITGKNVLEKYPFYSVDSTSWLAFQKFGSSKVVKDKKMRQFLCKTIHYNKRNEIEIRHYLHIEKYITSLWEKRGVKWDE